MSTSPENRSRRSLLVETHRNSDAQFRLWQDQIVVKAYGHRTTPELSIARHLGLCDLSTLDRWGFKGMDTVAWLEQRGIRGPLKPNKAMVSEASGLTARLSAEEHLILGSPFSDKRVAMDFEVRASSDQRVYSLPRQDSHAWLYLSGEQAMHMMSYVCAVDLSSDVFAPLDVAQTSVARLNAIVIRQDVGVTPGFHLLCDQPSATYWWETLLDAAEPLNGAAVGIDALLALSATDK